MGKAEALLSLASSQCSEAPAQLSRSPTGHPHGCTQRGI